MRKVICTFLFLAAIGLPACGGGGEQDGDDEVANDQMEVVTLELEAVGRETVSEFDFFFVDNGLLRVGDDARNLPSYTFLGFVITGIPADASVIAARVVVTQVGVSGTPYTDLGDSIVVDHIDVDGDFDLPAMDAPALDEAFATLSDSNAPGERAAEVTDQIRADLDAGRTRSEFRLRFPVDTNADFGQDIAEFVRTSSEGTPPVLIVSFTRGQTEEE